MSEQSSAYARDLEVILPDATILPYLKENQKGWSPFPVHRKPQQLFWLFSVLPPVLFDMELLPDVVKNLAKALQLKLPGNDPNDPGGTESICDLSAVTVTK